MMLPMTNRVDARARGVALRPACAFWCDRGATGWPALGLCESSPCRRRTKTIWSGDRGRRTLNLTTGAKVAQVSCAGIVSKFEPSRLVGPSSKCANRGTYTPSSTLRSLRKQRADKHSCLKQMQASAFTFEGVSTSCNSTRQHFMTSWAERSTPPDQRLMRASRSYTGTLLERRENWQH